MKKFLSVIDIKKKYDQKIILNRVNFEINRAEVLSILGINGAGKSTLISILSGIKKPDSGDILYKGISIYKNINEYKKNIGYCSQKSNLNNNITLEKNLYFAGKIFGISDNLIYERINFITEFLEIKQYLSSYEKNLSGGCKQRFMIARSLIHSPEFLIFDEPTIGMDHNIRKNLWDVIKLLKTQGVTIFFTSHYLDEVKYLSDRICFLKDGFIQLIDTPENLLLNFKKNTLEDVFNQFLN